MKKILGLVVSDRKLGNSELLLKEIMDNIPEPCTRELVRLTDLRIKPCKGCYRCLQPGAACMIDDDFNYLFNKIKESDALIIGLPVYFLGPHASFKMLIDRMLGANNQVEYTRGKPCIMVMPFGMPGWEGYTKTAALVLPRLLQMKLVDFWEVHATLPGESMLNRQNREKAKSLGINLFTGEFAMGSRECPQCGSDLFRLLADNEIECPLCAARGRLKPDGVPDFSGSDYCRFTAENLDEHFGGWLVDMKNKFILEKNRLKEVQEPYKKKDWWVKPTEMKKGNNQSALKK